jgi:hypothetical protein
LHHFDEATGFARLWIAELFANIAMYGYVAEIETYVTPDPGVGCSAARSASASSRVSSSWSSARVGSVMPRPAVRA